MRYIILLTILLSASPVFASYSSWATPTMVSIVLDRGFRIDGQFGNPNSCEKSDIIFVSKEHPQYDQLYSAALAAFTSGSRISLEIRKCGNVGWISDKTINFLDASSPGELRSIK